jgi:hypothetical protein
LGFDRLSLIGGRYALRGPAPSPNVDWIGLRLERLGAGGRTSWGIEGAAAANGSSAGYMEGLVHGGAVFALADGLRIGTRVALGFGGGGAVPSGGGTIAHLDATLALNLSPGSRLGAAFGRVRAASGAMRGTRAELSWTTDLEPALPAGNAHRSGTVRRMEWAGLLQQLGDVRRSDGRERALQTAGLQLNAWLGPNTYVTGQAHSALGGGAGAYGQGLVGVGIATALPSAAWQFGGELLIGAGGGGGVQSLAGPLARVLLWSAWPARRDGAQLRLGVGAASSPKGDASTILAVSWVVPFAQVMR